MTIEAKIDELIAALDRNTATHVSAGANDTSNKPGRKPKNSTESQQQPAPPPQASAATAPAASPPPAQPAAAATNPGLLVAATEAIVALANEYSRDAAVGILSRRGVTRCSDLKSDQWQAVLDEANAEIAKAKGAASSASLI